MASGNIERVKKLFRQTNWRSENTRILEGEIACELPIVEAEEYLENKANEHDTELEGIAHRGFKASAATFARRSKVLCSEVRPMEKELKKLREQQARLQSEERSMRRNMAAGHLRRVGAPPDAQQEVAFGAVGDENLMMAVLTKGASAEAFNELYQALRIARPVPEWVCTPEAAALPEKDLLGMCPGGKMHIDLLALTQQDVDEMSVEDLLQRAIVLELLDKPTVKAMLARVTAKEKAMEEADEELKAIGKDEKQKQKEAKNKAEEKKQSYKQEISQIRLAWASRVRASRCTCSICECTVKLAEVEKQIKKLTQEVGIHREQIRQKNEMHRITRRLARSFRAGPKGDSDDEKVDPVFCGEDADETLFDGDDGMIQAYRRAQQEWGRLESTLTVSDFPLRLVFLDKSGSMGCDAVTYDSLQLALQNCINPTHGSTLTFLFAGPGETEIILRRPGDDPVEIHIRLGCSTWFNEPIFRTLQSLAPIVERLDTEAWMQTWGQPPLQVLCMTDGQDNVSPDQIRTLSGLVNELKTIVGPESGRRLYMPLAGPLPKTALGGKVPVWMAWIACGMGGQALLDAKNIPKEITLVDAVAAPCIQDLDALVEQKPADTDQADTADVDQEKLQNESMHSQETSRRLSVEQSTKASRARQRMRTASTYDAKMAAALAIAPRWSVGHRVRVKSTLPGRAPKSGIVLSVSESDGLPSYEILFDDETKASIEGSQIAGAPKAATSMLCLRRQAQKSSSQNKGSTPQVGLLARTASPESQHLQVLAVVDSVTRDLAAMMFAKDPKSNRIALEDVVKDVTGSEEVDDAMATALKGKVAQAQSLVNITPAKRTPLADPMETLLAALMVTGRSTARLQPEDRIVAQRFLSVGVEMLVTGGSLSPAHLADQLGQFAGLMDANSVRRIRVEPEELETWHNALTQPLRDLLDFLLQKGLLEKNTTAGFDSMSALEDARSCYMAAWRFFDPSVTRTGMEDSLRRAVNRFQRLQPAFSFGRSRSSQIEATSCRNITALLPSEQDRPHSRDSASSGTSVRSGETPKSGTVKLPSLTIPKCASPCCSTASTCTSIDRATEVDGNRSKTRVDRQAAQRSSSLMSMDVRPVASSRNSTVRSSSAVGLRILR